MDYLYLWQFLKEEERRLDGALDLEDAVDVRECERRIEALGRERRKNRVLE